MARSPITDTSNDLVSDSGNVLWSFIKGEQLEFPIVLNFLTDPNPYTFEAVVVEGANDGTGTRPTTIETGGVQTTLVVRVPVNRGTWSDSNAYDAEDVVLYNGSYYKLSTGASYTNASPPGTDPVWHATSLNKIYIQFPMTLGAGWSIIPEVGKDVYGFFELRVTEPNNSIYVKTWKPVRGMVEIQFSPTEIVP